MTEDKYELYKNLKSYQEYIVRKENLKYLTDNSKINFEKYLIKKLRKRINSDIIEISIKFNQRIKRRFSYYNSDHVGDINYENMRSEFKTFNPMIIISEQYYNKLKHYGLLHLEKNYQEEINSLIIELDD